MARALVGTGGMVVVVAAALVSLGIVVRPGAPGAARAPGSFPRATVDAPLAAGPGEAVAVFAGGCFWGVEEVFEHVRGVKSATSGYAGGRTPAPTYDEVSSGTTGHAESVRVVYDPSRVTYGDLLRVFFSVAHDPTQRDRQGPDVGTQYRSIVFYANDEQKRTAEAYIAQLTRAGTFRRPIVTEVVPLRAFYPAEAYHQHYARNHPYQPYILVNDAPRVARLKLELPALYREDKAGAAAGE